MAWLAIDAGTSSIKAVVLDPEGRLLTIGRTSVGISRNRPGFAEQDMNQVWHAVVKACRDALNDLKQKGEHDVSIEGIACTAQGDGAWLVDRNGIPVGPAILWNDGRARGEMAQTRKVDLVDRAFRISGSVPYPGLACAILPWLAAHEPMTLKQGRWLLSANGWLHFRLTGKILAELSDASNPFSDVKARNYSTKLLDIYGLGEYRHLLPPIRSMPVSKLSRSAAYELGLEDCGLPVVMAPYDIVATAAGCGCTVRSEGCLILGTTICAEAIVDDPGLDREPSGTTIALADGGFLRAMPTLTGCEALDWASALFGMNLDEFSSAAERSPIGAKNLVFLPYLSPAGERSPFLAPDAKGSFHGLSLVHAREDVARAVFEGLCYAIRECLAAASDMQLSVLAVCGGGARSDFWCQTIADVCNCIVFRPAVPELGAVGAWRFARVATGAAASIRDAGGLALETGKRFEPSPRTADAYSALFAQFLKVRRSVEGSWLMMRTGSGTSKEGACS